jgi:hypothetical protein
MSGLGRKEPSTISNPMTAPLLPSRCSPQQFEPHQVGTVGVITPERAASLVRLRTNLAPKALLRELRQPDRPGQ